jgi:hypothetical protein
MIPENDYIEMIKENNLEPYDQDILHESLR